MAACCLKYLEFNLVTNFDKRFYNVCQCVQQLVSPFFSPLPFPSTFVYLFMLFIRAFLFLFVMLRSLVQMARSRSPWQELRYCKQSLR